MELQAVTRLQASDQLQLLRTKLEKFVRAQLGKSSGYEIMEFESSVAVRFKSGSVVRFNKASLVVLSKLVAEFKGYFSIRADVSSPNVVMFSVSLEA